MIKTISPDEFWSYPEVHELIEGYTAECHISGLPPVNPDVQMYRALHQMGAMKVLASFSDDTIIGFAVVMISPVAHYSARLAVMESVYVDKKHRHGGTGGRLIKAAEAEALEAGATGLFVSAPSGGVLEAAMNGNKIGYAHSNSVYFKKLT